MVGGGRRDEGSLVINNTNIFAALDSLRKKKKAGKASSKSNKGTSKSLKDDLTTNKPLSAEVFWNPAPITNKSWADVEDDDDNDYYSSTAPPPSFGWDPSLVKDELSDKHPESESEDDMLDEVDEDLEDYPDHDTEASAELVVPKNTEVPAASKEAEKQLSKKERKKKELADLDALLADFGVSEHDSNGKEPHAVEGNLETKNGVPHCEGESKDASGESKAGKKKKKKPSKEAQFKSTTSEPANEQDDVTGSEVQEEESSAVDVKEKLKKVAPPKKKKTGKEMDAAARAAAQEAAARSAKLAAAKKKEKNHYNQQPVR